MKACIFEHVSRSSRNKFEVSLINIQESIEICTGPPATQNIFSLRQMFIMGGDAKCYQQSIKYWNLHRASGHIKGEVLYWVDKVFINNQERIEICTWPPATQNIFFLLKGKVLYWVGTKFYQQSIKYKNLHRASGNTNRFFPSERHKYQ